MTAPAFQMNQFAQSAIKGELDKNFSAFTLPVQLDPDSVATCVPGDAVKLSTTAGDGAILVEKCAVTDVPFGFVFYSPKKSSFIAGDAFEIGLSGSVIICEAAAAITRGASLEYVVTGAKVKTNVGNPICGNALDSASAGGELIRVILKTSISVVATITGSTINDTPIGGSAPSTAVFTDLTTTGTTLLGNAAGDSIVLTGIVDLTASTIKGATPFVFEGLTADAFEASFAVPDITADRTWTWLDATGTVPLLGAAVVITAGATPSWTPGAAGVLSTLTPGENETIAAVTTGAVLGQLYTIQVLTSGSSSYTLTFGTNFKSTGTLATGTADAKYFNITFRFNGTLFVEVSRTAAM